MLIKNGVDRDNADEFASVVVIRALFYRSVKDCSKDIEFGARLNSIAFAQAQNHHIIIDANDTSLHKMIVIKLSV